MHGWRRDPGACKTIALTHFDPMSEKDDNPMGHPEEQPAGGDSPKFGRLLLVLVGVVLLIVAITLGSEALYS